jgi:hypothetical protein
MNQAESCWIEVESYKNNKNIITGCIYRHPHADLDNFSSQLEEMIKTFNHNNQLVYILGDLNIDFLKYDNIYLLKIILICYTAIIFILLLPNPLG